MADTGWTAADLLASVHYDESPAEMAVRMARQAADRQDRADAQAEADAAIRREEERDARLIRYQVAGIGGRSLADMAAEASRQADEEDRYQEALKTIAKVERRRELDAQAQRSQAVLADQLAQRAVPRDGVEAASLRARETLASVTRSARRAPLPFGRGYAVRNEPVTCGECRKVGASPTESFMIHHDDPPRGSVPDDAELAKYGIETGTPYRPAAGSAGRYQTVSAGGRDYRYDKRYGEMEIVR